MKYGKLTPNLMVADVSASLRFYQDVLGFQQALHVPEQPPFIFVSMVAGDVEVFLNQQEGSDQLVTHGGMSMYIEVEGLEELFSRVQQRGAKIVTPPHDMFYGMREFVLSDPDGYTIIIAQRIK